MKSTSTSTRDHTASEQEEPTADPDTEYFDFRNPEHCARVKEWCTNHWEPTIKKSMLSYNPLVFHDCCFCFSKRGFSKKANHRPLESSSILRIPTIKAITGPEGLFKWLLARCKSHAQAGRKTLFPTINRLHQDTEEEDEPEPQHLVYLTKRTEQLSKELETAQKLIEGLNSEKKKLLDSSRNWYMRYQEVAATEEQMTDWDSKHKTLQTMQDLIN